MMNALKPYENSFKKVYGTDEKVLKFQYKRYSDLMEKHSEYYVDSLFLQILNFLQGNAEPTT